MMKKMRGWKKKIVNYPKKIKKGLSIVTKEQKKAEWLHSTTESRIGNDRKSSERIMSDRKGLKRLLQVIKKN